MSSFAEASRSAFVVGVVLAVAGCFSDAPPLEQGSSSETSTGDPPGDSGSVSSAASADASDSSTSTGDATTTSSTGADTTSEESSTSGGLPPPECGCPRDAVLCEEFEYPLGDEWHLPAGGEGIEERDDGTVRCDNWSMRAQVSQASTYAAAVATIPITTGELVPTEYTVRSFVWVDPTCLLIDAPVRVLEIEAITTVPSRAYGWDIAIEGDTVFLRSNMSGFATVDSDAVAMPVGEWVELRLELDYAELAPFARLRIDGALEIETEPMNELEPVFDMELASPEVAIGPFFYDAEFPSACTIWYDDLWLDRT